VICSWDDYLPTAFPSCPICMKPCLGFSSPPLRFAVSTCILASHIILHMHGNVRDRNFKMAALRPTSFLSGNRMEPRELSVPSLLKLHKQEIIRNQSKTDMVQNSRSRIGLGCSWLLLSKPCKSVLRLSDVTFDSVRKGWLRNRSSQDDMQWTGGGISYPKGLTPSLMECLRVVSARGHSKGPNEAGCVDVALLPRLSIPFSI